MEVLLFVTVLAGSIYYFVIKPNNVRKEELQRKVVKAEEELGKEKDRQRWGTVSGGELHLLERQLNEIHQKLHNARVSVYREDSSFGWSDLSTSPFLQQLMLF